MVGVGAEAVGQGAAALEDAEHVEDDEAEFGVLSQLRRDAERAIERHSGVEQRGEFLGEEEDVAAAALAEGGELDFDAGALGGDAHVDRGQSLLAEFADHQLFVVSGEAAGAHLAV